MSKETERCVHCGGLGGVHGLVHVRHGNGGGHNEPCPAAKVQHKGDCSDE